MIEFEYYRGDIVLFGKRVSYIELKKQIKTVEIMYDKSLDNFTELFCRLYGWQVIETYDNVEMTYDRDTGKFFCNDI